MQNLKRAALISLMLDAKDGADLEAAMRAGGLLDAPNNIGRNIIGLLEILTPAELDQYGAARPHAASARRAS